MKHPAPKQILVAALAGCALLAGGCAKMREARQLKRGDADFAAGAMAKAEVEYMRARMLNPADPAPVRQLGLLYQTEGRWPQAYGYLKRAVQLQPQNVAAQVGLAQAYFDLNALKEARDAAYAALQLDPTNERALVVLQGTLHTPADAEEAVKRIAALRQRAGDCAGYHLVLAGVRAVNRDAAGAESELKAALALDPRFPEAHEQMVLFRLRDRDRSGAAAEFHAAAQAAPLRSMERLHEINYLLRSGSPAPARQELADLNARAPDYVPGWIFAMKLADTEHRYDDADAAMRKVLALDPTNVDAMLERAALKEAHNDFAGGIEELKKAEQAYPRLPQIKYDLASAYLHTGDLARARDRLNETLVAAPTFYAAALMLAEVDLRQADAATAVKIVQQVLARQPRNRQAHLLLAEAYLSQRDDRDALAAYGKMAEVFPKDPEPLYRAALILSRLHRSAQARQILEKAHSVAPGYAPVLDLLVTLDLEAREYGAAEARVDLLIAQYPKSAIPWSLRARIDAARKDFAGAEKDLNQAIELQPDSASAYFSLARLYVATHRTDQAVKQLAELVARTKSATAQLQIAAIHEAAHQYAQAADDYRAAIALDSHNVTAYNNLAFIECDRLHQLDAAYADARRARELAPESGAVADTLGWILVQRGDLHGGLDLFSEAAGRDANDPGIQYHLGYAHYMLGEEDAARVAFEHVLAAAPSGTYADEARERLGFLAVDPARASAAQREALLRQAKADPQDPVVAARVAALEARNGGSRTAAADLEKALKLEPQNFDLMLQLAQLYAGPLHEPEKARTLAKRAHEMAPDDAQTALTLGRLMYRTEDFKWSLDLLEQAQRQLPPTPDLWYDLALDYVAVGRLSDAQNALQSARGAGPFGRSAEAARTAALLDACASPEAAAPALRQAQETLTGDPRNVPALMVAALAKENAGEPDETTRRYEQVLAVDPLFTPAAERLARLYADQGNHDERAYALALQAHQALPDDAAAATTLGLLNFRREEFEQGAELLQQSLRERPDDAETIYFLGMCHYRLHELTAAKTELQRSLNLKLAGQEGEDAKRTLDELNSDVHGPSLNSQPIN